MISENPEKRPRFSELVDLANSLETSKPDESEFVTIYQAQLNNKQAVELQQNLFEMEESYKIYFFSNEIVEAQTKLLQISDIISSEDADSRFKVSIYEADILAVKKSFFLAEEKYLICLEDQELEKNKSFHIRARLLTIYQLIIMEMQRKDKIERYEAKIKEIFNLFEKEKKTPKTKIFEGFLQVHHKLLDKKLIINSVAEFQSEMEDQLKKKEIRQECKDFFKDLRNNKVDQMISYFKKIGCFLLLNLDDELFQVASLKSIASDEDYD